MVVLVVNLCDQLLVPQGLSCMGIDGMTVTNVVKLTEKFSAGKICTQIISSSLKTNNNDDEDENDSSRNLLVTAVFIVNHNKEEQK
jgi:hypothetical protein